MSRRGRGYSSHGGNYHHSAYRHAASDDGEFPPSSRAAGGELVLQCLDMGLDFRSYQSFATGDQPNPLGNVVTFPADKVADVFEPTVGLLVTLLHLYAQSHKIDHARTWLAAYGTIQRLFLEGAHGKADALRAADEAVRAIEAHGSSSVAQDSKLCEKLFVYLDTQCAIKGSQAPSQRRIPRDPKGTFCNLHLSDHRCNQEFACNQLHLHQAGPSVKHRVDFHVRMVEVLTAANVPANEIHLRLRDSLFYARYGNKVTVRYGHSSIPFFKTLYTAGRLDHALRHPQGQCPASGGTCKFGAQCRGLHVQDERSLAFTKASDLPNVQEVSRELDAEVAQITALAEQRRAQPLTIAGGMGAAPAATSGGGSSLSLPPPSPSASSGNAPPTPTTLMWASAMRDVRGFVRAADPPQQLDEALMKLLQGAPSTPSNSDTLTPLMHEVEMRRFDSQDDFSYTPKRDHP